MRGRGCTTRRRGARGVGEIEGRAKRYFTAWLAGEWADVEAEWAVEVSAVRERVAQLLEARGKLGEVSGASGTACIAGRCD